VTTVTPDDRVLLYPVLTCGRCRFCRNGPENQCRNLSLYHGAFAERAVVRAADLVRYDFERDDVERINNDLTGREDWRIAVQLIQ